MATNQLLKPNDVAIALNVSRSFAYFLIRTGQIPSVRIGQSAVRIRSGGSRRLYREKYFWRHAPYHRVSKVENTRDQFKGMIL